MQSACQTKNPGDTNVSGSNPEELRVEFPSVVLIFQLNMRVKPHPHGSMRMLRVENLQPGRVDTSTRDRRHGASTEPVPPRRSTGKLLNLVASASFPLKIHTNGLFGASIANFEAGSFCICRAWTR
jgi:hypothetical protein